MFRYGLSAMALLAVSQPALSQQILPGAGGQLRQIPPAPVQIRPDPEIIIEQPQTTNVPDVGTRVQVNSLIITGNSVFPEVDLIAAAGVTPGSELSLSELREAAARIAAYYNDRGYFLAQAYLPAQDIQNGAVTIAVVEGRYGEITVRNETNLSDGVARRALSGLPTGEPVRTKPLERALLLLSDTPGINVRSTLTPGVDVGTSDLLVDVTPGRRFTGSIEADNAGNRYTGAYRLGGSIDVNNPTGMGDLLSLRVLGSAGGLAYGRIGYEAPVGDATLGVAFTHLRYQLGREFSSLDADGTADIASVYGSYPLVRSRDANLYALVGVDAKWLHDRIGLVSTSSDRTSRVVSVGFRGDSSDELGGGGWNVFSAAWSLGDLHIDNPLERAADALTARNEGEFGKLQARFERLQNVSGPFSLYGALRGQMAFGNLDSSEEMELGGAYGVRAYPEGEAYGDEGYLATLEARLALSQWAGDLPGELELFGFVDTGEVRFADDPWFTGSNHASRSGIGAGLSWAGPDGLFLKGTYATRLGDAAVTSGPDKSGQFWFQASKLF